MCNKPVKTCYQSNKHMFKRMENVQNNSHSEIYFLSVFAMKINLKYLLNSKF